MKKSAALAVAAGAFAVLLSACQPEDESPDNLRRGNGGTDSSQTSSAKSSPASTSRTKTTTQSKSFSGARATTCKDYKTKSDDEKKKVVAAGVSSAEEVTPVLLLVKLGCSLPDSDELPIGQFFPDGE